MSFLKNNLIYVVCVALVIVVILSTLITSPKTPSSDTQKNIPSASLPINTNDNRLLEVPTYDPSVISAFPHVNQDDPPPEGKEFFKRQNLIGQLTDLLPYKGSSFSLAYSLEKNTFEAKISKNSQSRGLEELDQFLKRNQIESKDWIKNLVIIYE
jgi:hypothetical protein